MADFQGAFYIKRYNLNWLRTSNFNRKQRENKFDLLKELISNNIDIHMMSEAKLDPSFPPGGVHIDGNMPPIKTDIYQHGGRLLIYKHNG